MKPSAIVSILLVTVVLVASDVCAGAKEKVVPPGQPFQELQQQIDALKQQVMGGYAVFDSTGKKVGDVIGMAPPDERQVTGPFTAYSFPILWKYPVVLLEINGKRLTLMAFRNALTTLTLEGVFYSGQNCSGQAYLFTDMSRYTSPAGPWGTPAPITSALPLTVMPVFNEMVYVESGPPIPPDTDTICSYNEPHGIYGSQCVQMQQCGMLGNWAVPVEPVVNVQTLFTPPYTVKKQ